MADVASAWPLAPAAVCVPRRNCWCLVPASRATLLVDADAYFGAFAEAVARARETIVIVGWDLQASVRLRPGRAPHGWPATLREYLGAALTATPRLRAYLLDWDFSLPFALEREMLPVVQLGWRSHPRLQFRLDGEHPLTGCHHQKIVVVDDAIAFVGGLDLTANRWDTPAHRADESARRLPNGKPYGPFHDVQVAVSGEAARRLGALARARWQRATGERIAPAARGADPWPPHLVPDFRDVDVAIARTDPAFEGRRAVREVEALYLDSIAAARRWIYVENQYFTSTKIADAMAARLAESDGPEIVLVGPRLCSGWLEERTMGTVRGALVRRLRAGDRYDRFRALHPRLPGADLNVHSKVMIVDDALVRVGSSNTSNRSMGLDTECDVAIEARGATDVATAIAAFRDRLLAEHLDVPPRTIATTLARTGSLIATIDALAGGTRTLAALADDETTAASAIPSDVAPADPEHAVAHAPLVDPQLAPGPHEPFVRTIARAARALAGVACTTLVWRWMAIGAILAPVTTRFAFAAMAACYLLGAVARVPLTATHTVSALALGPRRGAVCAIAGAALTDVLAFAVGTLVPRRRLARIAGRHLGPIARILAPGRVRDVAVVRLAGTAPFPIVGLVAGTLGVPLGRYLAGTLAVLVPSALAVVFATWVIGG